MIPLQVQDHGRIVTFRSKSIFLKILHRHFAFMTTPHFKEKYGDLSIQQLWDTLDGHENLEQFRTRYEPYINPDGVEIYKNYGVKIYPIRIKPRVTSKASTEDDGASLITNEHARVAPQTPVPTLSELLAARIHEEIEKLVAQCEAAEGKQAAEFLRASITGVTVNVTSVSGNRDHWLVKHFDERLFQNNGN